MSKKSKKSRTNKADAADQKAKVATEPTTASNGSNDSNSAATASSSATPPAAQASPSASGTPASSATGLGGLTGFGVTPSSLSPADATPGAAQYMGNQDDSESNGVGPDGAPSRASHSRQTVRPLRLLIAIPPHVASAEAAQYAAWLSRTCPVTVQTITIMPHVWPSAVPKAFSPSYEKWLETENKAILKAIGKQLSKAGITRDMRADVPHVIVSTGSEAAAINRAAQEFDADLVLIGSHPASTPGRFLAGSTADALLHCAPVPLALAPLAPKLSKKRVQRINCAYVDTDQSHEALRKACDLGRQWNVPVRLVAFAPRGVSMYPTQTPYEHEDETMMQWREEALAMLDRGRERALSRHSGLVVQTAIGSGYGWGGAMKDISWKKSDLLLLGSSSLGVFSQVFIGSSTNQIVRHSPVPTIIVPV